MATPRKPKASDDVTEVPKGFGARVGTGQKDLKDPKDSQELTAAPRPGAEPDKRTKELLELWAVLTRARIWRALAVVPVPGASALATAQAIANAGGLLRAKPVQVMNAEGLEPAQVEPWIRELKNWVKRDERVLVVLSPVVTHPAGLPLVHAADAAILCVPLFTAGFADAHKTVELVGRGHFIGTVTIKAGKPK